MQKVDSKYKTCQTVCEDPFENIITILSTQHSLMLDDNFTLDGPDQALACMQVMFRLGETIYEATTKDVKRQTDPDTLQKEHSKTKVKRVDSIQRGREERERKKRRGKGMSKESQI